MTLREKLELAGYRLRALAGHMPTDWQRQAALGWADDAIASAMGAGTAETRSKAQGEARQRDPKGDAQGQPS